MADPSLPRRPLPLADGEEEKALLEVDLDQDLTFERSFLIRTSSRLVWVGSTGQERWQCALTELRRCSLETKGQVGTILLEAEQRTMRLCVSPRRISAARAFLDTLTRSAEDATQKEPPEANEPEPEPRRPSRTPLLRLVRFAVPHRARLLWGLLFTLLGTLAGLVPPYLTLPLMDEVLIPFERGEPIVPSKVVSYLTGLFGFALLSWALLWARTYQLALVSERIGADLRTHAFEHLLKLPLDFYGSKRTGDLMTRIGSETDRICTFLSLHALDFITDVLVIALTAAVLFSIDPALALATLFPLPLIAWLIHLVRDRLSLGFTRLTRVWAEVTNVLSDAIPGIRVVKAFGQEEREAARFREANRFNLAQNDRLNRLWALFSPTVTLLTELGLLCVWAFGIYRVQGHRVSVGVLAAFLAYIGRFYSRLDSMSRIVSVTQKANVAADRLFDILDRKAGLPMPERPIVLDQLEGRISLRSVGFRYGSRQVLSGLDLEIRPGEMIGLVGESGAGKSTLANLLCRFYDVTEGAILVDGVDLRDLEPTLFRRNIGLVLQEPLLFFGTVAENIAYGRPDASSAEIVAAARAAHAHEFILQLPHSYDSLVGERGQLLSGGERQRLSIARALLVNPKILILDEATSAVDNETEKLIQEALDELVKGRTTIAIAHRLSTLKKADRLVVLEGGRICEVGRHAELLAQKGAYYRLVQAEQRGQSLGESS